MAMTNSLLSSPGSLVRNVDRVCEDAQLTGELKLNSRKLKEFPKVSCKYDLSDVVFADLSKNRFSEIPAEVCQFFLLEQLDFYNNIIRFIPDSVINLQSLTCLNLSRNQLTTIPVALCHLPLQVCILRNNRLVSIPEEIGSMKCLRDLDVSCNEITIIPPQIGKLTSLQSLNLKRNLLVELPYEICNLRLIHLDVSANRISSLPTQLRLMTSLQNLILDQNPMTFPPAFLCKRGRIHVFKFLELQAIKEDKRGIVLETEFQKSFRSPSILSDVRFQNGFTTASCRKSYTFDSGYNTSDGDSRSQESQEFNCILKRYPNEPQNKWDSGRNQNASALCNFVPTNVEEEKITEETTAELISDNRSQQHIQTYKEYKEALKQQRACDTTNIYKKNSVGDENTNCEQSPKLHVPKTKNAVSSKNSVFYAGSLAAPEDEFREKHHTLVSQWQYDTALSESPDDGKPKKRQLQNSPILPNVKKYGLMENKQISCEEEHSSTVDQESCGRNISTWPKNSCPVIKPAKSNFTIRREFDKAREELELVTELREILESRLKLKLPEEIGSALMDGVFLCHLANHVHPNSVACIHVPSPAVPKLTVAKCRRNVDNFLEACRRLGVPNAMLDLGTEYKWGIEAELCRWEDMVVKQNMAQVAPAVQTLISTTGKHLTEPTDLMCSPQDVLGEQGGLVRVAITVQELVNRISKT